MAPDHSITTYHFSNLESFLQAGHTQAIAKNFKNFKTLALR